MAGTAEILALRQVPQPGAADRLEAAKNKQEWSRKNNIYFEAVHLAVEFTHANKGVPPGLAELEALYAHGYLEHEVGEILEVTECESIGEFQDFILTEYGIDKAEEDADKRRWLEIIQLDESIGALHPLLFKVVHPDKDNPRRYVFEDEVVGDATKIKRYVRYRIAERLTPHLSDGGNDDEALLRRTSIALNINVKSGASTGSYYGGLYKSNNSLGSPALAREAVNDLLLEEGWQDYFEPELRASYLRRLLKDSKDPFPGFPNPRSYYDTATREFLGPVKDIEAYCQKRDLPPERIRRLGEILIDQTIDLPSLEINPYKFRGLTRPELITYGRWLLKVLEPYGKGLNIRLIARAHRIFNLGVSEYALLNGEHFSYIDEYYTALGEPKRGKNRFSRWRKKDWIAWVQAVASENDGRFNEKIIRYRVSELGLDEPTWKIAKDYGVNQLRKEAGLKPYNEKLSPEQCAEAAADFFEAYGYMPRKKDIVASELLPSTHAINTHCGTIANLHRLAEDVLLKRGSLLAQAV